MTKMVMKQKHSKFTLGASRMKALYICQSDLENVIRLT